MSERTREFLDYFVEFEGLVAKAAKSHKERGLSANFNALVKKKQSYRQFKQDVLLMASLRNVLVHERSSDLEYLAEPLPSVTERLKRLVQMLDKPDLIATHFHPEVREFSKDDTIAEVLDYLDDKAYSQAIVRIDGKLNVLGANTFQRWVASHIKDGIMELTATVADVMAYQETPREIVFVDRKASILDALDYFGSSENIHTLALVVTEKGHSDQTVLGLMTPWDLAQVHQILDME